MTALAIRDDQTQFDQFQVAVLRQSGVDEDVTNAELAAFLHTCQRRQLDPFAQQIYLIGRWDKSKGRKVYKPQTSIDGFRLIARRAADRSGIDYEYEDTVWFGPDGSRHDVWLGDGPPAAAKIVVVRNGKRYDAVARYAAYVQTNSRGDPSGQWRTMADHMTAKCAEALALRKAFPEDLGGLYTADEMGQADTPADFPVAGQDAGRGEQGDGEQVTTDAAWLADVTARINAVASRAESQHLWHEINAKGDAGACTLADVKELRALIIARVDEIEADDNGTPDQPLEGQIVDNPSEPDASDTP